NEAGESQPMSDRPRKKNQKRPNGQFGTGRRSETATSPDKPKAGPPPSTETAPKSGKKDPRHRRVHQASLVDFRRLRTENRAYYRADFDGFRETIRKAFSETFRKKPGPKPKVDPRIRNAARKRARGADWPELYADGIDGHSTLRAVNPHTCDLAEESFRRK